MATVKKFEGYAGGIGMNNNGELNLVNENDPPWQPKIKLDTGEIVTVEEYERRKRITTSKQLDRSSWVELVYRLIEFYKWEPHHFAPGKPFAEFYQKLRRHEVPLNFVFNLLLSLCGSKILGRILSEFNVPIDLDVPAAVHINHLIPASLAKSEIAQPDCRIEYNGSRIFVEMKVKDNIRLKQVQRYLLLHSALDVGASPMKPYLLFLTDKEFAKCWSPRTDIIADIHEFLRTRCIDSELGAGLQRKVKERVISRYHEVKKQITFGASTWNKIAACLNNHLAGKKSSESHDIEAVLIDGFVHELKVRGLYGTK